MQAESPQDLLQQANDCLDRGQLREACNLYHRVCSIDPANGEAWLMLGALHGETGNIEAAVHCLETSIKLQPQQPECHDVLGRILLASGQAEKAATCFRKVVHLAPTEAAAWSMLAGLEGQLGNADAAMHAGSAAVRLDPGSVEAHVNLANALAELDRVKEAAEQYTLAVQFAPANCDIRLRLALMQERQGDVDAAMDGYRAVLQQQPGHLDAVAGEARMLELAGDAQAACGRVLPHIDAGMVNAGIALAFASLSSHHGRREQAIALLAGLLSAPHTASERSDLHFALGKLYDQAGEYGQAFGHFEQANRLRDSHRFAIDRQRQLVFALISTYSESFVRSMPRAANTSDRPVFIIGMPRSGTSLVEQILASHADIHGAGELWDIGEMAAAFPDPAGSGRHYPLSAGAVTPVVLDSLAEHYLARLQQLNDTARRVTDKMPHNFLYLGLIAQLFPRSRIIHCTRNPLDTCLSCYCSDLQMQHGYANDLVTLGAYYRLYQQLMEHWKAVMDLPILDIGYEALVGDLEQTSRRMVEFCDLPWDENCLRFAENTRIVTTLSHAQVRQPLYSRSINRAAHYREYLQPLIQALGKDTDTTPP